MKLRLSLVFAGGALLIAAAAFQLAHAPGSNAGGAEFGQAGPPIADPSALAQVTKDPCSKKQLRLLPKADRCTHGPDPTPPGLSITKDVAPAVVRAAPTVSCDGDGVSGKRVEVLYVHASDKTDRYSQYLSSFRQWASDADQIYQASAAETGGSRRLRFVQDSSCQIAVADVTVSTTGDDNFDNTISELRRKGYTSSSRKYMLWVDANVYCGVGTFSYDDRIDASNSSNSGPSYGRSDAGCWSGFTAAHELMHNLGGVQYSAPNTSGGAHCTDEYDVMCYSDSPYYPAMRYVCTDSAHEYRLDCNHDDYYNTNPPAGSYLAGHWNAANSDYLIGASTPQPPPCADLAFEPDDSSDQARTVSLDVTETHAFCLAGDQDWVRFQATAGQTYAIQTLSLASGADTVLDLYQPDATTLIAHNDDSNGLASLITFTADAAGSYYVKASDFDSSAGGAGLSYNLRIGRIGVPGAPAAVSAVADNAQATVSWTPPGSNGGSAITGYTVTSWPAGGLAAVSGSQTSTLVTGLTNGTSYTFTVTAANSIGTGPSSSPSNAVTPTLGPLPVITSFSPSSGTTGTNVVITGTGFTGATAVTFAGTNAQKFTVNSSTKITATVASGTTSGTIIVTGPGGTGTSSGSFTVKPKIQSFSPAGGLVGASVVISGTGFIGATAVKFNGTSATTVTVNSSTQITATVPSAGTTGKISVTTPGGTATSGGTFTVYKVPTITSFTPTSGAIGVSVVITGTNFTGATAVKFHGTNAQKFTVNSSTKITATVASGTTRGTISVTGPAGAGTSSASFTVT